MKVNINRGLNFIFLVCVVWVRRAKVKKLLQPNQHYEMEASHEHGHEHSGCKQAKYCLFQTQEFKNKLNHLNPVHLKSLKLLPVFYACKVFEGHFQGSLYVK